MVAAELFADRALDATKMEDVAAATGLPKATLYYHFAGKEDILAFLFNEILDEVGRAVEHAVSDQGPAVDRLRAAVLAHLGVFVAFPAASRALQATWRPSSTVSRRSTTTGAPPSCRVGPV